MNLPFDIPWWVWYNTGITPAAEVKHDDLPPNPVDDGPPGTECNEPPPSPPPRVTVLEKDRRDFIRSLVWRGIDGKPLRFPDE